MDIRPPMVISLAKREEEIYIQARSAPVRLPRNNEALRLLQQMRDEAHRFAQHYHHTLRRKRTFDKDVQGGASAHRNAGGRMVASDTVSIRRAGMRYVLMNRRALVCGSSQGIGRACAVELARAGAEVTLVARTEERLAIAKAELPTPAGQVHHYLVADFAQPDSMSDVVSEHVRVVGPASCSGQ